MIDPNEIYHGAKAKVILSRRDNESGTAPEWDPPRVVTLYVKRRLSVSGVEGQIVTLTILDFPWAEYSQADYSSEYDEWLCEEYRMKILEVL